jgi:thioredoxin-related protein
MLKQVLIIMAIALLFPACKSYGPRSNASRLTQDEKHRLYSAALAASESPLDTDTFKEVCREIGIFDADGKPNNNYIAFVSEHVEWGTKSETDQFRREISSKDKAREYIRDHLDAVRVGTNP